MVSQNPPSAFEKDLNALEETVRRLEQETLPLDDALALFERGMKLSRNCQHALDRAERRIETLTTPTTDPDTGSGSINT